MKRLLVCLTSFLLSQSLYALDTANLKLNISNVSNSNNNYFLCLPTIGCVSLKYSNRGQNLLITTGKIDFIGVLSRKDKHIVMIKLPASCQLDVSTGQTVTVSGMLQPETGLKNLSCRVG